jgi:hypothetical protein
VISPQGVHPEVLKASMPNRPDSPEAAVTPNTGKGKGPS